MSKKVNLEISVPQNWKAVTLRKYLELLKDMEVYKDTPEAVDAALFHHLCGVDVRYLSKLDISIYTDIRTQLHKLMSVEDLPLVRRFHLDGIEWGFEPNLSEMSYGAYVDIQKYEEVKIDKNWAEIMSILYRPVTNRIGELYEIKPYSGKIDKEKFLDVSMDVHFGAMFFFLNTLMDLLKDIQSSMKEELQKKVPNLDTTLIKNGVGIHRFINLPKVIS